MQIIPGSNLYSIGANWKLLVENSFDGNHGVPVHSTYFEYVASHGENPPVEDRLPNHVSDLGNGHAILEMATPYGRPIAHWHPLFGEDAKEDMAALEAEIASRVGEDRAYQICHMQRNLLIFPNLIIVDGAGLTVRAFEPKAPDLMEVSAWHLEPSSLTGLRRRAPSTAT